MRNPRPSSLATEMARTWYTLQLSQIHSWPWLNYVCLCWHAVRWPSITPLRKQRRSCIQVSRFCGAYISKHTIVLCISQRKLSPKWEWSCLKRTSFIFFAMRRNACVSPTQSVNFEGLCMHDLTHTLPFSQPSWWTKSCIQTESTRCSAWKVCIIAAREQVYA